MRYIWSAFQPITRNVVTERAKQKKKRYHKYICMEDILFKKMPEIRKHSVIIELV